MSIPAQNTITLNCSGAAGYLTLTTSDGTAFAMTMSTGISIPGSASLGDLSLNAGTLCR